VARGLAVRLFDHGFARGWWRKGDLVADPFCGICGFGIIAAYKGLRFVGVEIEERFHSLCLENVALHRRRWQAGGDVTPLCLRGDSRQFAALVAGAAGVVTSPPYAGQGENAIASGNLSPAWREEMRRRGHAPGPAGASATYGVSEGQVAALPQGDADSVITSPPYADAAAHPSLGSVNKDAWGRDGRNIVARRGLRDDYGTTPGQIGALKQGDADSVVTSPPYAEGLGHGGGKSAIPHDTRGTAAAMMAGYGDTPGNVGGLAAGDAGAVVTSPPWEDNLPGHDKNFDATPQSKARGGPVAKDYGNAPGQVGALRQETYWDAVRAIYGQCFLALRPGGVACVVVKSFIRKGALVDLPGQTWRLLLSLGFRPVERIRCLLSEETREPSLFGGDCVKRTERQSFFRRLATKKGAPSIDFEEILVVRRPAL
jgi:hypothetical protein